MHIRLLRGPGEFRAAVRLQERIWGIGFPERLPASFLGVVQEIGGVVAGAVDDAHGLVGLVAGIPGRIGGEAVHWSDLLGVDPEVRNRGIGTALKWFQRETLLDRGVVRVFWSFDPLESRNAFLNIRRLGAIGVEYVEEMYGPPTSPLHEGLGTDRMVVEWRLGSARVEDRRRAAMGGPGVESGPGPAERDPSPPPRYGPVPREGGRPTATPEPVFVPVPPSIQELKASHPDEARAWRARTRRMLADHLRRGFTATDFDPVGSRYRLDPPRPPAHPG